MCMNKIIWCLGSSKYKPYKDSRDAVYFTANFVNHIVFFSLLIFTYCREWGNSVPLELRIAHGDVCNMEPGRNILKKTIPRHCLSEKTREIYTLYDIYFCGPNYFIHIRRTICLPLWHRSNSDCWILESTSRESTKTDTTKQRTHARVPHVISTYPFKVVCYGPLIRYAKLRVAHVPGIPGTPGKLFLPPTSKDTARLWSRHACRDPCRDR